MSTRRHTDHSDDWLALRRRLDLDVRDLTEPEHIRAYFRHAVKHQDDETVIISPVAIRTVAVPNQRAVRLASEVVQEMLGQKDLALTTTSQLLTWTRRDDAPAQ